MHSAMPLDPPANQFHWRKLNTSNEAGVFYEVPKGSMTEKPKRKSVQSEAVSSPSKMRRSSNLENVESINNDIHQTNPSVVPDDRRNKTVQKSPLFNKTKKRVSHMQSQMSSVSLNVCNDVVGDIIKSLDRPLPSPKTSTTVPPAKRLEHVKRMRQSWPNFGSSKAAPLLNNCKRQTKSLCQRINSSKHQRAHMGSTLSKQTLNSPQSKLKPDIHKTNELQASKCLTAETTIKVSSTTAAKKTTGQQSKTFDVVPEHPTIKTTGRHPKAAIQKTTEQQSKTFAEVLEQSTIKTIDQQPKTVSQKTSRQQPKTVVQKTTSQQPKTVVEKTTSQQPKTVVQKTTSQKPKTVHQKTSGQQPKTFSEILEQPTISTKVLPRKVSVLKKKLEENKGSATTKKNSECEKKKTKGRYKKVRFLDSETESDEESSIEKSSVEFFFENLGLSTSSKKGNESPRCETDLLTNACTSPRLAPDSPEVPRLINGPESQRLARNACENPVADACKSREIVSDAPESPEMDSDASESAEIASNAPGSPEMDSDTSESPEILLDAPGGTEIESNASESPDIVSDGHGSPRYESLGENYNTSVSESFAQLSPSSISSPSVINEMSLTSIAIYEASSSVVAEVPDIITLSDDEEDVINISDTESENNDETDQEIIYLEEIPRTSVETLFRKNSGLPKPKPRLDEKTKMLRRQYFANVDGSLQDFLALI